MVNRSANPAASLGGRLTRNGGPTPNTSTRRFSPQAAAAANAHGHAGQVCASSNGSNAPKAASPAHQSSTAPNKARRERSTAIDAAPEVMTLTDDPLYRYASSLT